MHNLKVGHYTDDENGTGVSVFLFEAGATGGYCVQGSSPASHELVVLNTDSSVPFLHGLVLSGGSAFGLYSASGVMKYLNEKKIGHTVRHGVVPIVPAAAIYDLHYKVAEAPTKEAAYIACQNAREDNVDTGRIGAGTGATVGKIIPDATPMRGGLGRAEIKLENGTEVVAYAVVNCVGDVKDDKGKIIAGAVKNGIFANCEEFAMSEAAEVLFKTLTNTNTTLVAVFTNASFTKGELTRIAKMAIAGMARSISPVFTRYDGDLLFAVSVGQHKSSEFVVGAIACEAVRLAILNAVSDSKEVDLK